MTYSKWLAAVCVGSVTAMAACSPTPAPAPGIIYAEPVFDKFGNPSCRPGDVPVGGAYTVDLPICPVIGGPSPSGVISDVDAGDGGDVDNPIDDPVDDPNGGNQNQNQNTNQNQNSNQNTNQNQNSNQGG